jgi:hypothetical protein
MQPIDHQLAWLAGRRAAATAHSGGHLLGHLEGTRRRLAAAGQPAHVCAAGLFHSVYGTNTFRTVIAHEEDREAVRALIGVRAERLAWLFSRIERPRLLVQAQRPAHRATAAQALVAGFGLAPSDAGELLAELAVVEVANLLEQSLLWQQPALLALARRTGLLGPGGFSPYLH